MITEIENALQKHYTPVTMADLKKAGNTKCRQRSKATGALTQGRQECEMAWKFWESSGGVVQG